MLAPVQQDSIFDAGRLSELKRLSGQNSPEAIKAVAKQFEALFLQMMLKQMRQSTAMGGMQGGGFDGEQVAFYRGLADQQLAMNLSKTGSFGLAKAIERQLSQNSAGFNSVDPPAEKDRLLPPLNLARAAVSADTAAKTANSGLGSVAGQESGGPTSFINRIWNHALGAAKSLGVPTQFLVGHAALETGWGKGEIRMPDGGSSHNLFNIKAGSNWKGATVDASTIEYIGGVPQRRVERFRAYGSYAEAFADYARLIGTNSRYSNALGQNDAQGFAQGLARGGYATDPMYADKLTRIIDGKTLRSALSSNTA